MAPRTECESTVEDIGYATREAVMSASDIPSTAYLSADVDSAIASATSQVDKLCHRGAIERGIPGFLPWTGTLAYDWPNDRDAVWGRLWLERHSLLSLTSLTSGGVSIPTNAVLLEPANAGPPYNRIELDRAQAYAYGVGSGTGQRSIQITGVWLPHELAEPAYTGTTVSGDPSDSTTSLSVTGPLQVGQVIRIDTERLLVQEKTWATSSQTGTLDDQHNAETLAVSDGSVFRVGEELLIDAERLLVRDVAGNNLIVKRAWSGSTLAEHTAATIYWPRSLTVKRGVLGTTAASHTAGAQVYRTLVAPLVRELTIAYALDTIAQQGSAYARTIGSDDNQRMVSGRGIRELEERVYWAHGRRRHGAV